MAKAKVLEAGAALGAAGLLLSGASLLSSHAPGLGSILDARPGDETSSDLRAAELASGTLVVVAGGVASVFTRAWWPLMLAVATVGTTVVVYEVALRAQRPRS